MHAGIASQKCLCIADSLSCPGNKSVHASIAVKMHNSIPTCVCLSARPKLSNLTSMQRGARSRFLDTRMLIISIKICLIIFILAIHPVQGYPGSWFLVYNLISTPPKMPRSTVGMRQYKSKNFRKIRLFGSSNYQDQDKTRLVQQCVLKFRQNSRI